MTFYRWFFAIVILAPFALPQLRGDWPIVRRHWKVLLGLGVIGIGTHNALAYLGLRYTTAVNGVILNSFIPVMIVALSWVLLRERLASLQVAGIARVARRRADDPFAGIARSARHAFGSTPATC